MSDSTNEALAIYDLKVALNSIIAIASDNEFDTEARLSSIIDEAKDALAHAGEEPEI